MLHSCIFRRRKNKKKEKIRAKIVERENKDRINKEKSQVF